MSDKIKKLANPSIILLFTRVIPEKIHTPTTEGMVENLTGRRGGLWKSRWGGGGAGGLNLKVHPTSKFSEIALHFQILLFFQTIDLLPHQFFKSFHP